MQQLQTNKADLNQSRLIETSNTTELNDGEVKFAIDRFSFTANNITYAVLGNAFKYWQFFPTEQSDQADWGMIPVWGFAKVVESKSDDLKIGERFFGYYPPATNLIMKPVKVSEHGFTDSSEHRAMLPPAYNSYRRATPQPSEGDNALMLLYPLHLTAFVIRYMLQSNDWFGAEQILIISASSKTSTGLAYALEEDESAPTVIGLTSERNLDLVRGIGVYDDAMSYEQLTNIDATKATVIVDMSANAKLLSKLHTHLGDNMKFCSNVGLTHWDEAAPTEGIITERSEQFFAPTYITQLIKQLGQQEFDKLSAGFLQRSASKSSTWLKMTEIDGLSGLEQRYPDICTGNVAADEGLIVVM